MNLGLAGVVSGAGEAGTRALSMAQAGIQASQLQAERDKMDNLRQDRLLENQRGMQTENLRATALENTKNRTLTKEEGEAARKTATENTTATLKSHEETTAKTLTSHEGIAKGQQANALEIAKLNNAMHERVAKLQRDMQTKQFDKTFTAAKMTATTTALKDLSDQMIHLNVAVSNPLADKTSPEYKSAVEILQKAQRLHMVFTQQLADMIASGPGGVPASPDLPGNVKGAMPTPALPPFVPPPVGKTPTQGLANDLPVAD